MFHGIIHLSFWGYVLTVLLLTHLSIMGVTIFLHRCQAHRALDMHPVLAHIFRFWLWFATGMVTKKWVAIHRKHHAKVETPEDPHSPQQLGLPRLLFDGVGLYRQAGKDTASIEQYGHAVPNDWIERHLYAVHDKLGWKFCLPIVYVVLFGVLPGLLMWGVQILWIPFWAAGIINGVGHFWGYRNYETPAPDASTNIVPFGILIGGEELHNNHHCFPSSAKFSLKWWEFDIGWLYIRLFEMLGLVKVKRLPPELYQDTSKAQIDVHTVRALITHRLRVMDTYWRHVMVPVFNKEKQQLGLLGQKLFKTRAKRLLVREESMINTQDKQYLDSVLQKGEQLKVVYQFKLKLQGIWQRTKAGHQELALALQEWCQQADGTGIDVLKHFAASLKTYALPHKSK